MQVDAVGGDAEFLLKPLYQPNHMPHLAITEGLSVTVSDEADAD